MPFEQLISEILALPEDLQREVVERVQDSWNASPSTFTLSDATKAELDRRIADMDANPDDEMSFEEFRQSLKSES